MILILKILSFIILISLYFGIWEYMKERSGFIYGIWFFLNLILWIYIFIVVWFNGGDFVLWK